jgi:hypothetical protein
MGTDHESTLERQLERLAREWETTGRQIHATMFALGLFTTARPLWLTESDKKVLRDLENAFPMIPQEPEAGTHCEN